MGVEPTQDESIAPQTVLKTAVVTGPRAAPLCDILSRAGPTVTRRRSLRVTATLAFRSRMAVPRDANARPPRKRRPGVDAGLDGPYFARSISVLRSWASLYSDSISRNPPGNS